MDERQRARVDEVVAFRDDMRKYAKLLLGGTDWGTIVAHRDRVLLQSTRMQRLCERVVGTLFQPSPFTGRPPTNVWLLALHPQPGYDQYDYLSMVADHLTTLIGELEDDPSLLDPPPPPPPPRPTPGPQTINIHGGTVNIAQTATGDVTQQNVAATNLAEVRRLINEMIAAIEALDAPEEEREGFVAPIETLKAELRQPRPIASRLAMAYVAIQGIGTIESAWQGWERVQRIAGELGPHLHQVIQAATQG